MESELIKKFEIGFRAGVQAANPKATVKVKYAGGFDKADVGKATAESMYKSGVDVIYHAAGATGTGVFTEAKNLKKKIRSGTYGLSVLIKTSTRKVKSKAQKTMSLSHQWSKKWIRPWRT